MPQTDFMQLLESWFRTLSFDPLNTVLLLVIIIMVKRQINYVIKQHEEMYAWYIKQIILKAHQDEQRHDKYDDEGMYGGA